MIKAVLFDMDGTVLDTEKTYYSAWHQAARLTDYKGDIDADLRAFSGTNLDGFYEYYRSVWGDTYDPTEMLNVRTRIVEETLAKNGIFPMPGAVECLRELREMGILCAVATSSVRKNAERFLTLAGIKDAFDALQAGDEVENGKPHPEIFLRTAALLGVDIADCVVVEDSYNGVRAGHAAGARAVMVPDMLECTEEMRSLLWQCLDSLALLPDCIREENEKLKESENRE
jgi:HAD superfamily hydrolase (TIGR01509 family)